MKKIIWGSLVLALVVSTTVFAATSKNESKITVSPCVAEAVSVREEAALEAWTVFRNEMDALLESRKEGLETAWASTTVTNIKVNTLSKAVWQRSDEEKKAIVNKYKTAKKEIWATYKAAVKACGGSIATLASKEKENLAKLDI